MNQLVFFFTVLSLLNKDTDSFVLHWIPLESINQQYIEHIRIILMSYEVIEHKKTRLFFLHEQL